MDAALQKRLAAGLDSLGLEWSEAQLAALGVYLDELQRWSRRINLTAAAEEELVTKHLLDCLAGLPLLSTLADSGPILDVGSGAGFPGLPLALFLPQTAFTLCEKVGKKAAFLNNCRLLLGLQNVNVEAVDYRKLPGQYRVITFRAFAPLGREIDGLLARLASGGCLAAYKGRRARIEEELAEARRLEPGLVAEIHQLQVPGLGEERHLVVVRKGNN